MKHLSSARFHRWCGRQSHSSPEGGHVLHYAARAVNEGAFTFANALVIPLATLLFAFMFAYDWLRKP